MVHRAEPPGRIPATVRERLTRDRMLAILAVFVVSALLALLLGPGFGLLVVTLSVLAAALWITYASVPAMEEEIGQPSADTGRPVTSPSDRRSIALPRPSLDRARAITIDRGTLLAYGPALAVILAITLVWYARDLSTNPPSLFSDEAMIGLQASGALNGEANFQFGRIFYSHFGTPLLGALPVYSTWPFVTVFGLDEFGVRFASSVYTALALVFVFLALRRLRVPYPILPVLIVGTQPIIVHLARINFGHAPSFFLLMVATWLWIRARQEERVWQAALAGFIAGVAAYGHLSFVVGVPLFVVAIVLTELLCNRTDWRAYRSVVAFGASAVVAMLPHAWLALTDERYWDRLDEKQGGNISLDVLIDRLRAFPNYFSYDYLFRKGEAFYIPRHSIQGAGELYPYMLPVLVIGIVSILALRRRPQARFFLPFVFIAIFYPIPDAISHPPQDLPYTFAVYWAVVALPFLTGAAVWGISVFVKRFQWPRFFPVLAAGTAVLALAFGIWFYRGPMARYPLISADYWGWQYGPRPITDYFRTHADQYDELLMTGDFNGAWVFPKFYFHGSALEARSQIGGSDNVDFSRRQLIAMRTDDWTRYQGSQYPSRSYLMLVDTIYYADGTPAFYLMTVDPALLHLDSQENQTPVG